MTRLDTLRNYEIIRRISVTEGVNERIGKKKSELVIRKLITETTSHSQITNTNEYSK